MWHNKKGVACSNAGSDFVNDILIGSKWNVECLPSIDSVIYDAT